MDSETITTISAVLGIVGESIAIAGHLSKSNEGKAGFSIAVLNSISEKFYSYLFASATWVLLVLSWFLGFEPYGPFLLDREVNQLIALMMSFPVIIAFLFSIKHLFKEKGNTSD